MEPAPSQTGSTEQPFEVDELFFSATDRKGIITSGNSVFVRVSGYGRDELVGRAHNLVRHPDMPRAVFQVLWDYLEAGRPIAAYVKNLAKNGNHYWVVATVAPTEDGGYLSVRIKPTAGIRDVVEPLYAQVRAQEHALEAAGTPRKEVVAAGVELLVDLIGKAGFSSYDELMRHFLPAELAQRDAALGYGPGGGLSGIGGDCLALKRALDRVFAQLDRYSELERGLDGKAAQLAAMAERARLSALNATISASRLGDDGRVLAAIAMLMRREAGETEEAIQAAAHAVEPTRAATGDVGFDVCLAKIQAEMALYFLDEPREGRGRRGRRDERPSAPHGIGPERRDARCQARGRAGADRRPRPGRRGCDPEAPDARRAAGGRRCRSRTSHGRRPVPGAVLADSHRG